MSGESMDRQEQLRRSLERSGVFLVDEMSGKLTRYASSRGLDEGACEEVVQEAFVAAFRRRTAVTQPEAWLVRVVDRRCGDGHRRRRARAQALAVLAARRDERAGRPASDSLDLDRALARLPEKLRRVVELRYLDGLGAEEAAARLGYSPASYRSTLSRTLRSLRELLRIASEGEPLPISQT